MTAHIIHIDTPSPQLLGGLCVDAVRCRAAGVGRVSNR